MRKIALSTLLSASLLAGCGAPATTTSISASQRQNVQSFYGSLGLANDGTLHKNANSLFSASEFQQADTDRDGRLAKTEMESFFKAQASSELKLSAGEIPTDPQSLALIGLSGGVLAGYLAFAGAKVSSEILHPTNKAPGLVGTDTIVSDDLSLSATYTPASVATDRAVVLCHPLGSSKEAMAEYAAFLKDYNVLAIDFRNHGASQGKDTTGGLNESHDVLAAVSFLKMHGNKQIGVLGIGMGAVAAIDAAATSDAVNGASGKDINALIAENAYSALSSEFAVRAKKRRFPLADMVGRAAVMVASLRTRTQIGKGDAGLNVSKMKAPSFFITLKGGNESLQEAAPKPSLFWQVSAKAEMEAHRMDKADYEAKVLDHLANSFSRD